MIDENGDGQKKRNPLNMVQLVLCARTLRDKRRRKPVDYSHHTHTLVEFSYVHTRDTLCRRSAAHTIKSIAL